MWGWAAGYHLAVNEFNATHPDVCVTLENDDATNVEYTKIQDAEKAGTGAPDGITAPAGSAASAGSTMPRGNTASAGSAAAPGASGGLPLSADPFTLSAPVQVTAELPAGWTAGRLRLWLEGEHDQAVLAATHLDIARKPAPGTPGKGSPLR